MAQSVSLSFCNQKCCSADAVALLVAVAEPLCKGRYTLPVFMGREHSPRTRVSFSTPVNTGRIFGCRSVLLVNTARRHDPWPHVVCTQHPCWRVVMSKSITWQCFFANTVREHVCWVHTTRVRGPLTRPVNTGIILETREHVPSRTAGPGPLLLTTA